MARQKGMLNLSGNIEVNAGAPFDARDIVPTKADLTVASNFPYPYVGMETYVVAEDKKYRYMGGGVTSISNWKEITSGGGSVENGVVGIHKSDYEALPEADKNNGSLYMVDTETTYPTHEIDMSNITKFEEGSTHITATSDSLTTIASPSGQSIGATYYYNKINVTNITEIVGHIKTTGQYTPHQDRLSLTIGLCSTAPDAIASNYTDLGYAVYDKTAITGEKDFKLDVSNLTGEYYIVVNCPGWTATISDLKDDSTKETTVSRYEMFYKSTELLEKDVN